MKSKTKLQVIGAAVLLSVILTGCAEGTGQSSDPNAYARVTYSNSYLNTNESTPIEESSAVAINGDVMWGLGKTVDEVTEKYGSTVASGPDNVYTFENGYGIYEFGGYCYTIGELSASDLLVGDLSTVTLDNIAEKCGFNVVPLNDTGDTGTMYDGYKMAYYTHPSYDDVMFGMLYNENGFDETAKFDVRLDSRANIPIKDEFINTLNSVIDSAASVDTLNSSIRSADADALISGVRVFEHPNAFIENNVLSSGAFEDGAVILVVFGDGSCYITTRGERTTELVPVPNMLAHIVQRADSTAQLKAELDGFARGGRRRAVSSLTIYRDGEAMSAGSGKAIIEYGELVGTDDDLKSGAMAHLEYDGGESYIDFSLTEF